MINADMKRYDFYTLGSLDEYGQQKVSDEKQGSIIMAIYTTSQSTQANALYLNAQYMGLTHDTAVNDTYVIDFNGERLKVLYVGSQGRFKRVFMARMG